MRLVRGAISTMKRLDLGHLHPNLEIPRLGRESNPGLRAAVGGDLFRKEPCESPLLKGHGNEAGFLGFLHKSVRHRSLTLHFEYLREFEAKIGTARKVVQGT